MLIVIANLATVVVGGVVIWLVDRRDFEHLTEAFWYILQTITTVGYGDVTPIEPVGRLVGAAVMLLGLAFISILTATITSSLIEARQAERRAREISKKRSTGPVSRRVSTGSSSASIASRTPGRRVRAETRSSQSAMARPWGERGCTCCLMPVCTTVTGGPKAEHQVGP